jgi:hypothetical protein
MEEPKDESAEITFESGHGPAAEPLARVTGVSPELLKAPEKIRQLMDLLELPEGTNARLTVSSSTTIVR